MSASGDYARERDDRKCSPEEIRAALKRFLENGPRLRAALLESEPTLDPDRPLDDLNDRLHDERGLPKGSS